MGLRFLACVSHVLFCIKIARWTRWFGGSHGFSLFSQWLCGDVYPHLPSSTHHIPSLGKFMAVQNFPRESWDKSHDFVCILIYIILYIEREASNQLQLYPCMFRWHLMPFHAIWHFEDAYIYIFFLLIHLTRPWGLSKHRGLGFAMPVFCGLSWLPLVPRRHPLTTLVGAPLWPQGAPLDPTEEQLGSGKSGWSSRR